MVNIIDATCIKHVCESEPLPSETAMWHMPQISKCDNWLTTLTIKQGFQEQIELLNEGLDNFSPFLSKDGAIKQAYLPNHLTDNAVHPSRFLRF